MTDRLHLSDSYLREFEGTVRAVEEAPERIAIELDRTAFYAESGGQPADRGRLGETEITDVELVEGRVLHHARSTGLAPGDTVAGSIDWRRRFDHMQQHTGQHVLSQAFVQTLKAATVSFHLGSDFSTVDLDAEGLEPDSIYAAEDLANSVLFEDRPVVVREIDSREQDRFPIRKPSAREGRIRLVEVRDFDWSPCGGTHCSRTGEVGLIKIRRWERHRGRARVEFVCGGRALRDYRSKNRTVYQLTKRLSASDAELVEAADQLAGKLETTRKRLRQLSARLAVLEAGRLVETAAEVGPAKVIRREFDSGDAAELRELALEIVNSGDDRIVLFALSRPVPLLLLACSPQLTDVDLRQVLTAAASEIDGRGGGTPHLVQAGGKRPDGIAKALAIAQKLVEDMIHKHLSIKDS